MGRTGPACKDLRLWSNAGTRAARPGTRSRTPDGGPVHKIFLGVDGGGTKCRMRLTDSGMNVRADWVGGPANLQIERGAAKGVAENTVVTAPGPWLRALMKVEPTMDSTFSFAPAVWLILGQMGVMFIVMRYTVVGRRVFAIGSNEDAARMSGINVTGHKVLVLSLIHISEPTRPY